MAEMAFSSTDFISIVIKFIIFDGNY